MGNTAKGAPFPASSDAPNIPADIEALAEWTDARAGISVLAYADINALAGADLWTGRLVYQIDTGTSRPVQGVYEYNGVAWRLPWNLKWGEVVTGRNTANVLSSNTTENVIGGGWEPTAVISCANRLHRITVEGAWRGVAGNNITIKLKDGTTQIGAARVIAFAASVDDKPVRFTEEISLGVGSHPLNVTQQASATSVENVGGNYPLDVTVEDIGPAGDPA